MMILLARIKSPNNFRSEMPNFFDEPRQTTAGFHFLIFYTKVFNKPQ